MTVVRYFILTNSTGSLSKKFRVIHGGYRPTKMKRQTVRQTLDGKLDISSGGIFDRHEYLIRVRETDPEPGFGTKDDLDTFFSYNNPNGAPSNRIGFTDHFGNERIAVMDGDFTPVPVGVVMEGENAIYTMQAVFWLLPQVGGS